MVAAQVSPSASPRIGVEPILEEICRKFCAEQERHLREVVSMLQQAAFQEVQRLRLEMHGLRQPSKDSSTNISDVHPVWELQLARQNASHRSFQPFVPSAEAASAAALAAAAASSTPASTPAASLLQATGTGKRWSAGRLTSTLPSTLAQPPLPTASPQALPSEGQPAQSPRRQLPQQPAPPQQLQQPPSPQSQQQPPKLSPTMRAATPVSPTSPSNVSKRPVPFREAAGSNDLDDVLEASDILRDIACPGTIGEDLVCQSCHLTEPGTSICEDLDEDLEHTILDAWGGKEGNAEIPSAAESPREASTLRATLEENLAVTTLVARIPTGMREVNPDSSGTLGGLLRGKTTTSTSSRARATLSTSSKNVRFNLFSKTSGMLGSLGSTFKTVKTQDSSGVEMDEVFELPKTEAQRKTVRRLQSVLGLGSKDKIVTREVLTRCLSTRMSFSELGADSAVGSFLAELHDIFQKLQSLNTAQQFGNGNRAGSMITEVTERNFQGSLGSQGFAHSSAWSSVCEDSVTLDVLATVVSLPDPTAFSRGSMKKLVSDISEALLTVTTEEAIDEVTKSGAAEIPWTMSGAGGSLWETRLNIVVSIIIVINLVSAGVSVDHWVGSIWWVYLETFCTTAMVVEALIKNYKWGIVGYFTGEQSYWNWLDLSITLLGVMDATFTILNHFVETHAVTDGQSLRITVAFRALRMARIVRMVKVVNNPLLKDLAKMVVGFIIGLPQMIWVMVMFGGILYLTGLFFRLTFGPGTKSASLSEICPTGDEIDSDTDPTCLVHILYGEEYFSTVQVSMFTCFRFMLGDYGTRGGKNLVVSMSQHYGFWFNGLFGMWMIVVIFGVFNIISAIFVDATITGLKHNEIKKKYVQQYEKRFVREKLTDLMDRIRTLCQGSTGLNNRDLCRTANLVSSPASDNILLDEGEFIDVMNDPVVKSYLQDLDIVMHNPADLFDTFDPHRRGRVTGPDMVEALVKLRGEPQKNDLVATWLSLRGLHEKVDELRTMAPPMQMNPSFKAQSQASHVWTESTV